MNALKGAVVALVSSLLVALLFAYTFRIPVPMGGMLGPFGAFSPYSMNFLDVVSTVSMAWLFYGIFGGFLVLPLCGALAGYLAGRKYSNRKDSDRMIALWSAVASAVPVFGLSVLDYIIGPW